MNIDIKYNHPWEYLKEKRLSMNLSLRGLSSKAGVSHTEISKVENGERENPSKATIFKICAALELNFVDIAPLFNIEPTIEEDILETNSSSEIDSKLSTKLNTEKIKQSGIYALNKVSKEISEKYNIDISSDKFKEGYKLINKSNVDYVCLTDNDMVIGVEIKVVSNKLLPNHLQGIKGTFADFYFSFHNSYNPDNMLFFVCFISENDEAYEAIADIYKDDFYKFMPILNTRLYKMSDALN